MPPPAGTRKGLPYIAVAVRLRTSRTDLNGPNGLFGFTDGRQGRRPLQNQDPGPKPSRVGRRDDGLFNPEPSKIGREVRRAASPLVWGNQTEIEPLRKSVLPMIALIRTGLPAAAS